MAPLLLDQGWQTENQNQRFSQAETNELCNPTDQGQKKKKVRPSIQPKGNERLQSPGKRVWQGLKTRGDQGLFGLWPGHIYGVGMEYSHGFLPISIYCTNTCVLSLDFKLLCFGKVRLRSAIKTLLLRPGQHLPISGAYRHLSSEQEYESVHYPVFTQTQPQIQGSHSCCPQEDHNLFQRFQGLIAPWNYLQTFMYFT